LHFGYTQAEYLDEDWDTLWGKVLAVPGLLGEGGGQKETDEQKRDRRGREYLARTGARPR